MAGEKKIGGKNAFELFPELMGDLPGKAKKDVVDEALSPSAPAKNEKFIPTQARVSTTQPPPPPDIGWLKEGIFQEKALEEDIPAALVFIDQEEIRTKVQVALEELGFQIEFASSEAEALILMQAINFAVVIMHTGALPGKTGESMFHQFMESMAMIKRRQIFYAILGPEQHTLYDIEALTLSANLVVNDDDIRHISLLLRKGFRDYENLFQPYIKALRENGRY